MKIVTVVGARPQFIKAAAVSRAIDEWSGSKIHEIMVHTGQHYDENMSDVFFSELGIRPPRYNLGVAGVGHGEMTGKMLIALERVFLGEKPDVVLIYGDTNSTLAAALAASKLHIPVAHVEAGLRSFNMRMPEEVNRIVADRLSRLLFCPTTTAVGHLRSEGITKGVHLVGDVMLDVALHYAKVADQNEQTLAKLGLREGGYTLATCHRAENTDDAKKLKGIILGLTALAHEHPVILPLHPRTKAKIAEYGLSPFVGQLKIIDPASYLEMVALEKNARLIVTDSGGVQKEAFFYQVPCVTVRDETEWVETVDAGWNILASADRDSIVHAASHVLRCAKTMVSPYGDGQAANLILQYISEEIAG